MPSISANGIRLNYRIDGAGEPLLLLHGLGSSLLDWEFQIPFFQRSFQVITVDMRGHGKSDKPAGKYSIVAFAEDIACLLSEIGCGPAHVLGLSMGGMVALELALNHPSLLKSLTVVNALPEVRVKKTTLIKRWLIINIFGMRVLSSILARPLLPGAHLDGLRKKLVDRWSANQKRAYSESGYATLAYSATGRLNELKIPLTVVASEFDYWPIELKRKLFQDVPEVDYVIIPDAHHLPSMEVPDIFNELVLDILSKKSG